MKNLLKLISCFTIIGICSCSSHKSVVTTTTKTTTETVVEKPKRASERDTTGFSSRRHPGVMSMEHSYKCCYGDYTSKDPVSCPTHNIDLITVGAYYCIKCDGVTSTRPGNCPVHKIALKQML